MGKILLVISILLTVIIGVGLSNYATPGHQNLLGNVRLASTAEAHEQDKKVALNDWSRFGTSPEEAVKQGVATQPQATVTKPAPVVTTQPAASAPSGAISASKDVADKIVAAAPLVLEALKECPKPIAPAQITSHWGNESSYCPGLPAEKCPVSVIRRDGKIVIDPSTGKPIDGAHGPMGHMRSSWETWGKPGESPEVLADAMKMTVRHLCFARGKGNIELDPSSDAAILRYNPSTEYLKSIRAKQGAHEQIWAAIMSGKAPTFATTEMAEKLLQSGCVLTPRGNFFCAKGTPLFKTTYFPFVPLTRTATWVSSWGDRRNHGTKENPNIVPHGGFDAGCHTTGEPLVSACNGTVVTAAVGSDGLAGKMVAVVCGDEKITLEHMDRIDVVVNQTVTAGEQIGTCGHTGNAEPKPGQAPAPHAHIQLAIRDGKGWKTINPCAAQPGTTVLECVPKLAAPGETRLNPIRDVAANN